MTDRGTHLGTSELLDLLADPPARLVISRMEPWPESGKAAEEPLATTSGLLGAINATLPPGHPPLREETLVITLDRLVSLGLARQYRPEPGLEYCWLTSDGRDARTLLGHVDSGQEQLIRNIDVATPHIARIYDYALGGKDNYAADRDAAEEFFAVMPSIRAACIESRRFLRRAVTAAVAEGGILQFLDIGTGLPTAENTHEVAQKANPRARVVYVDNDPSVLLHARALLAGTRQGTTTYLDADARDTGQILADAARILDFRHPVALMMIGLLHCIPDADDPWDLVGRMMDALAPGSWLILGHPASDIHQEQAARATGRVNERLASPLTFRSREQIGRMIDGLDLLPPGLVHYAAWRPPSGTRPAQTIPAWCFVARKPSAARTAPRT